MARRAQETERPVRRRRASRTRDQTEGVLRAADSAKDAGEGATGSAKDAAQGAADTAKGAAGAASGQAATAQAASEIAGGAMEATRNVAMTAVEAAKDTLANGARQGDEGLVHQVVSAAREAAGEVFEREARAAARQAAEVLAARAPEIAREQLQKRGGSDAAARAAVEFGRAKLQGAGGTKALTAAAVGAVKESAGGLRTKVTGALGGDGEDAEGGTSRLPVEASLDIGVPRTVVWDEWMQFENSPEALHRIQLTDDGDLKVSSKVWGSTKEEEVEITEQVAEERLAWRADGAIPYRGVVTMHSLDENLTRLLVTLEFEPQGLVARLGAGIRSIQRAVDADVKRFKAELETRGDEDDDDRPEEIADEAQDVADEPEVDAEVVDEPDDDAEVDEELPDAEVDDELPDAEVDDELPDAEVDDEIEEPEDDPEAESEEPRRPKSQLRDAVRLGPPPHRAGPARGKPSAPRPQEAAAAGADRRRSQAAAGPRRRVARRRARARRRLRGRRVVKPNPVPPGRSHAAAVRAVGVRVSERHLRSSH